MKPYPICLAPQVRTALWGREIWLASGLAAQPSVIVNGPYAGRTLADLDARFPLLVKIIEAEDRLSLQVHPSETTAARCGGDPKTEMWYALDGSPGAEIIAGLREGMDGARLIQALRAGEMEAAVRRFAVRRGDVFFIPGGLVHAIGGGCRLYEVQQPSDTTWRLHDWNRTDPKTGQPRTLNEREGLAAIDWSLPPPVARRAQPDGPAFQTLIDCPQFRFARWNVAEPLLWPQSDDGMAILFVEEGACAISTEGFPPVELAASGCAVLPAGAAYKVTPLPMATLLVSTPGAAVSV